MGAGAGISYMGGAVAAWRMGYHIYCMRGHGLTGGFRERLPVATYVRLEQGL